MLQLSKPQQVASSFTIVGEAGMGKTTIAASFPKPVFICTENGMMSISVDAMPDAFPLVKSTHELLHCINQLLKEEHDYKTLVIDSVTKLDRIGTDEILAASKVNPDLPESKALALAMGGYGAGYQALAAIHGRVKKGCDLLIEQRGMKVIFLAHSEVEQIDLPDQPSYQRFSLKMNKRSMVHYVDDVDVVAHLKLESFIMKEDKNKKAKATSDGTRILVCHAEASNVSKNRLGISEPITVQRGVNPFQQYL